MVPRQRPAEDRHEDSIIPKNALPFRAAVVNRRVLRQVGEKTVRFYHRRDDGLLGAGLASSPPAYGRFDAQQERTGAS